MLILASQSPRRQQLLAQMGLQFQVVPSGVEEAMDVAHLPPVEQARALALAKARDVARRYPQDLVLGADTIVVLGGRVYGKPRDRDEAVQYLLALGGRAHTVVTAVALVQGGRELVDHEQTTVWMRPLTRDMAERYVNTGEPLDKAGAYAVQGLGGTLVEAVYGCYYNVVGLPLPRLARMLEAFGVRVP